LEVSSEYEKDFEYNTDLISSNLEPVSTQCVKLEIQLPQQGQQDGQSEETILMRVLTSNLNPHLIRPIQEKVILSLF